MPDVIDDLKNNPHKLKLGGEKRTVTILFSDIRGFTTISEKLSPAELTRVINEYLTAMTDIIMDHKGLVDKYIGDAIMAFWGAPVENTNQAEDAGNAVIAMSDKLKELNIEWKTRGIPEINIGVGLNKGEVIVGNMGSEKRFNYTIMGDEVNFCSRLEGLTKKYGVECLISESMADGIINSKEIDKQDFLIREMDTVIVKGKKEPKKIFELITNTASENGSGNKKEIIKTFEKGLDLYKQGKWDEALEVFNMLENDAPSAIFINRALELRDNPPADWKGVYEHTSK
jgi:adenylate cyclase